MGGSRDKAVQAWRGHDTEWRNPADVVSRWGGPARAEASLLDFSVKGRFWDVLAGHAITLLVTREYEHLAVALSADGPVQTHLRLPHPSGLAVDRRRGIVHIACTRNPNQVIDLMPADGLIDRSDVRVNGQLADVKRRRPLVPVSSVVLPGSFYIHDLAMIGSTLFANAVGQNSVVRLARGRAERAWWPRCIDTGQGPLFSRNVIQLNSIAAGPNLRRSFFSASTDRPSARRPSHRNFPVDRRGVIFSGATRDVMARGLTRPHSARLHRGRLWVDNSGYGDVGVIVDGRYEAVTRLPGWTRGLCFHDGVAFVGTSRVLPRFSHFAPGVDADRAVCGVHAVEVETGKVIGSLTWRAGNQIFAIDWVPSTFSRGLPYRRQRNPTERERLLFYAFDAVGSSG